MEYVIDTPEDIAELPITAAPGSKAIVVSTSEIYMMNNQKEWIKLKGGAGSGGGSGLMDEGIFDGGEESNPESLLTELIFDGGEE